MCAGCRTPSAGEITPARKGSFSSISCLKEGSEIAHATSDTLRA
jgi:hypothetical protein